MRRIKNKDKAEIIKAKKSYIGRVSSIMKRLDKKLNLIEETRRIIQTFPDIKEDLYTVCINGFPNVGKSTLLTKITSSKPEIGSYAFTTKTLNTGYFKDRFEDIQVVDVPGSLNRFEKMNDVEKQAEIALKYLSNLIVYVYDLTEPYPLEQQEKLFKKTKEELKPVLIYFSKADILGEDKINKFIKEKKLENATHNPEELKKKIIEMKRKK